MDEKTNTQRELEMTEEIDVWYREQLVGVPGDTMQQQIERLLEDKTTAWISVEDRLPEHSDDVWVYDKDRGICVAHDWYGSWYCSDDFHDPTVLYKVTHWQPIKAPQPPKDAE